MHKSLLSTDHFQSSFSSFEFVFCFFLELSVLLSVIFVTPSLSLYAADQRSGIHFPSSQLGIILFPFIIVRKVYSTDPKSCLFNNKSEIFFIRCSQGQPTHLILTFVKSSLTNKPHF